MFRLRVAVCAVVAVNLLWSLACNQRSPSNPTTPASPHAPAPAQPTVDIASIARESLKSVVNVGVRDAQGTPLATGS